MTGSDRRGAPWGSAVLLVVVVLVMLAVPLARPAAADTDFAATYPYYTTEPLYGSVPQVCNHNVATGGGTFSCSSVQALDDGDDASFVHISGSWDCHGTCAYAIGYRSWSGAGVVSSIRVFWTDYGTGWTDGYPGGTTWRVTCGTNTNPSLNATVLADRAYTPQDTGIVALTTSCDVRTNSIAVVNTGTIGTREWGPGTFQIYGTAVIATDCKFFIEDFHHDTLALWHQFHWQWLPDSLGSTDGSHYIWSFKRADGNGITIAPHTGTPPIASGADLVIGDATSNHQAPWVLSIVASTTSCTLSIADSDRGTLIPKLAPPHLINVSGCYNATLNACVAPLNAAAARVKIVFTLAIAYGRVQVGPAGIGPCAIATVKYDTVGTLDPGSYGTTAMTVDTTTDSPSWVVVANNAAGADCTQLNLNYSTGSGKPVAGPSTQLPKQSCDLTDFGCQLQNVLTIAEGAVVGPVTAAVDALRGLLLTKQPFAMIVRASDGMGAQLARASAAVTTTATCPGYIATLPVPSPYWPTAVPAPSFAVLSCDSFEPLGGKPIYQTIRTVFIPPAMFLLYAYAKLRQLQPRLMVGG